MSQHTTIPQKKTRSQKELFQLLLRHHVKWKHPGTGTAGDVNHPESQLNLCRSKGGVYSDSPAAHRKCRLTAQGTQNLHFNQIPGGLWEPSSWKAPNQSTQESVYFLLKAHQNEVYRGRQSLHNPLEASEPPSPSSSRLRCFIPDLRSPVWGPAPRYSNPNTSHS